MTINEEVTKKLMTEMILACDENEKREESLLEMGITVSFLTGVDAFFNVLFKGSEEDYWDIILDRSESVTDRVERLMEIYKEKE